MGCDSPLDQKIKANVVADLFSMAGVVAEEARMVEPLQIKKPYTGTITPYGGRKLVRSLTKERSFKLNEEGSKEEKIYLKDTIDEYQRRGFFKRIFPTVDFPYYK